MIKRILLVGMLIAFAYGVKEEERLKKLYPVRYPVKCVKCGKTFGLSNHPKTLGLCPACAAKIRRRKKR